MGARSLAPRGTSFCRMLDWRGGMGTIGVRGGERSIERLGRGDAEAGDLDGLEDEALRRREPLTWSSQSEGASL